MTRGVRVDVAGVGPGGERVGAAREKHHTLGADLTNRDGELRIPKIVARRHHPIRLATANDFFQLLRKMKRALHGAYLHAGKAEAYTSLELFIRDPARVQIPTEGFTVIAPCPRNRYRRTVVAVRCQALEDRAIRSLRAARTGKVELGSREDDLHGRLGSIARCRICPSRTRPARRVGVRVEGASGIPNAVRIWSSGHAEARKAPISVRRSRTSRERCATSKASANRSAASQLGRT